MMDNVSNDILTFYMYVHINYIWYGTMSGIWNNMEYNNTWNINSNCSITGSHQGPCAVTESLD